MDVSRPDAPDPPAGTRASFGALLHRYRLAAGLTQEELAERAGLSVQGLSALENGRRQAPYRHTVTLLANALGLSSSDTAILEAAVVRRRLSANSPPSLSALVERAVPMGSTPAHEPERAPAGQPVEPALPTGTLTFLLTDIEGSTAFWEQHPGAMQEAIARHDVLMDEVLAQYGGRQVKERGEGDSIFAVFTGSSAALAAACALQHALLEEPWPAETRLRVRLGLHTGEAELRGIGYYGVTVNRAARIRSLGHGGQILLSQATADLVRGVLPEGVSLRALGAHRLKGLAQPEEIWQVVHPGLPTEFPPLASPSAHPSNLPLALTSFIGREREQEEVRALLDAARLVTLTGAGGTGKTRLALAVAGGALSEYPDGVWLVGLAPLSDPTLVVQAVAVALGLQEQVGQSLRSGLLAHLKERHLLLVLDNCEHLVPACAELATALLQGCPEVRVLATSREGLGVAGERLYRVPSLATPRLDPVPAPERLGGYASVALFVARAQERRADFSLSSGNARAVAEICARLDGMPLAIELAAARVSAMPVEAIAARLDDRFRLLTGGPRMVLARQQTLLATLDWSHNLLSDPERVLLRRLAVFSGGWTLETAEAVCSAQGVAAADVLELLGGLVNKSLVLLDDAAGEARYRLLETVRQYTRDRLEASGESAEMRERHLGWYLGFARAAEPLLRGPEQEQWLARLEGEHDNLRAALEWSLGSNNSPAGLELAGYLWRFWYMHGHLREGLRWLERTLEGAAASESQAVGRALNGAGNLALALGDHMRAAGLLGQGLTLRRRMGDTPGVAASLANLGTVARLREDYAEASALMEESIALYRALGDTAGEVTTTLNLASVKGGQGEYALAARLYRGCLSELRARGDQWGTASALVGIGIYSAYMGDFAQASAALREGLALYGALEDTGQIAWTLDEMAEVAAIEGDHRRSACLYGAAAALYRSIGSARRKGDADVHARAVAATRAALGDAAYEDAYAHGFSLDRTEAIAYALRSS